MHLVTNEFEPSPRQATFAYAGMNLLASAATAQSRNCVGASHVVSGHEAEWLLQEIPYGQRGSFYAVDPVFLMSSREGRASATYLLQKIDGRFMTTLTNVDTCLGAIVVELVLEPLLEKKAPFFKDVGFDICVGQFIGEAYDFRNISFRQKASELDAFLATLDPDLAPSLFSEALGSQVGWVGPTLRQVVIGRRDEVAEGLRNRCPQESVADCVEERLARVTVDAHAARWRRVQPLSELADLENATAEAFGDSTIPIDGRRRVLSESAKLLPDERISSDTAHVLLAQIIAVAAAHNFADPEQACLDEGLSPGQHPRSRAIFDRNFSERQLTEQSDARPSWFEWERAADLLFELGCRAGKNRDLLEDIEAIYAPGEYEDCMSPEEILRFKRIRGASRLGLVCL